MITSRTFASALTTLLVVAAACSATDASSSVLSGAGSHCRCVRSTDAGGDGDPEGEGEPGATPIAIQDGEPWIVYLTIIDGSGQPSTWSALTDPMLTRLRSMPPAR